MNRNRRIFIIVFIVFTTIVALLAIDMADVRPLPGTNVGKLNGRCQQPEMVPLLIRWRPIRY